jgi:hypothetical protein
MDGFPIRRVDLALIHGEFEHANDANGARLGGMAQR